MGGFLLVIVLAARIEKLIFLLMVRIKCLSVRGASSGRWINLLPELKKFMAERNMSGNIC